MSDRHLTPGAGDGSAAVSESGAWKRALALVALVMATSVVQPSVLVAVPLLVLVGAGGVRGAPVFVATVLAMVVVVAGARDGMWYTERAWALMVGGAFAVIGLIRPSWRLTTKTLTAVATTVGVFIAFMAIRADAWGAIDWAVSDQLRAAYATWLDAMTVLRQGEPLSPSLVSAIYRTVEAQVSVFPALVAIESMAALAVTWWLYQRLAYGKDRGLGPIGRFGFSDHLVWVMVVGMLMVVLRTGEAVTRIGANLAVFMSALYAARGFGVIVFVSGGLSFFGYAMLALGLLFAAPVVIGLAVLLGVADSWVDLRERAGSAVT